MFYHFSYCKSHYFFPHVKHRGNEVNYLFAPTFEALLSDMAVIFRFGAFLVSKQQISSHVELLIDEREDVEAGASVCGGAPPLGL